MDSEEKGKSGWMKGRGGKGGEGGGGGESVEESRGEKAVEGRGGLVFHFFPRARRTKAIVEDPIVED